MIYIKKGKEPDSLTKYKKQKFAYYDGYKEKDDNGSEGYSKSICSWKQRSSY